MRVAGGPLLSSSKREGAPFLALVVLREVGLFTPDPLVRASAVPTFRKRTRKMGHPTFLVKSEVKSVGQECPTHGH